MSPISATASVLQPGHGIDPVGQWRRNFPGRGHVSRRHRARWHGCRRLQRRWQARSGRYELRLRNRFDTVRQDGTFQPHTTLAVGSGPSARSGSRIAHSCTRKGGPQTLSRITFVLLRAASGALDELQGAASRMTVGKHDFFLSVAEIGDLWCRERRRSTVWSQFVRTEFRLWMVAAKRTRR
jgi:hypothetical protein